jgi:hypothetical protein
LDQTAVDALSSAIIAIATADVVNPQYQPLSETVSRYVNWDGGLADQRRDAGPRRGFGCGRCAVTYGAGQALGQAQWNIVMLPQRGPLTVLELPQQCWHANYDLLGDSQAPLLRLIETDSSDDSALRLLLAAVALTLAGIVLVATWPNQPASMARIWLFIAGAAQPQPAFRELLCQPVQPGRQPRVTLPRTTGAPIAARPSKVEFQVALSWTDGGDQY